MKNYIHFLALAITLFVSPLIASAEMCISILLPQLAIPEIEVLARQYVETGGHPELSSTHITYCFSSTGESMFSQGMYQLSHSNGLVIDRAMMFTEQPATILDELVPVVFLDSVDDAGNQMPWRDYLFIFWITDSGTVLMKAAHHSMRTGLTDDIRKVWHENFSGLLTKAEGLALIPVVEE